VLTTWAATVDIGLSFFVFSANEFREPITRHHRRFATASACACHALAARAAPLWPIFKARGRGRNQIHTTSGPETATPSPHPLPLRPVRSPSQASAPSSSGSAAMQTFHAAPASFLAPPAPHLLPPVSPALRGVYLSRGLAPILNHYY
jgi:hypothetical protein